ncbi:TadE/TadG family type IV pilus assembly protein [Erythrobacter mangrovi]|uniref:Pilus assembly protein n=1 Tax=Erythrobacter mangrovi TaxID=2739433 RepID=A0A7D3XCQ7_9SPHN|nr:TadE/TadG family type IV pilus assembly protein [Erythrobacter mangrovi]QKG71960.1 pilus assembly protein [Erythrobacter mangrovi]
MIFAFIQRLIRDKSGVGFVELALVAPLLALMFLGMVDLSRIVATRIDLEQAAQRTTDFALAKRPPNGNTSDLVNEAVAASGQPSSDVTVRLILECDGTAQTSFTANCTVDQETRRFATVAIRKTVDTGFNWRGMASIFTGQSATYVPVTVTGDSVVRLQ